MTRAAREELFDDPVFERMEGHDNEPAAVSQHALRRREPFDQFAQFVIDGDAQRLKAARRRMNGAGL